MLSKQKKKNIISEKHHKFKTIGPIELNPVFDEKEFLACGFDKTIYVLKVAKNEVKEYYSFSNSDVITSISWQNQKQGYLATSTFDKKINLFNPSKEKYKGIHVNDSDICNVIKFSNLKPNILVSGYDRLVKIWDVNKFGKEVYRIDLAENIDIIDFHYKLNFILIGSSSSCVVKIYNLIVINDIEYSCGLVQTLIPDFDFKKKKIINFCFMPIGHGVVSASENQIIIDTYKNAFSEHFSVQKLNDISENLTFLKVKSSNSNSNHNNMLFVENISDCKDNKKYAIYIKTFYYEESTLMKITKISSVSIKTSITTFMNHIEMCKKNFGRNIAFEDKSINDSFIFNVRLSYDLIFVILKLSYQKDYPTVYPIVEIIDKAETYNHKSMKSDIEEKIKEWKNDTLSYLNNVILNLFNNIYYVLEKFSNNLNDIDDIKRNQSILAPKGQRKLSMEGNVNTIPYFKSNGICWSPKGNLVFFKSNKIDFKMLKSSDKIIKKENDLTDWIKYYSENKSKFSRSDNKLFEEDNENIITEELKTFIEWKGFSQIDDDFIIKSLNRIESQPTIMRADFEIENKERRDIPQIGNFNSNNLFSMLLKRNNLPANTALAHIYKNVTKDDNIISKIRISPIRLRPFYKNLINFELNNIVQKSVNIQYLKDIMRTIYFNLNSMIINNNDFLSVQFSKKIILNYLKEFEKKKQTNYLLIIVILLTTKIFNFVLKKPENGLYKTPKPSSAVKIINSFQTNEEKNNYFVDEEHREQEVDKATRKRSLSFNFEKESFYFDKYQEILPDFKNYQSILFSMNDESSLTNQVFDLNSLNNMSTNSKFNIPIDNLDHQTFLMMVFGNNFVMKLLDYNYLLSNILYRYEKFAERAELMKFFFMITSNLKIKKYDCLLKEKSISFPENESIKKKENLKNDNFKGKKSIPKQYNKEYFKNFSGNILFCEICGRPIKKGSLSVLRSNWSQIHFNHLKTQN